MSGPYAFTDCDLDVATRSLRTPTVVLDAKDESAISIGVTEVAELGKGPTILIVVDMPGRESMGALLTRAQSVSLRERLVELEALLAPEGQS